MGGELTRDRRYRYQNYQSMMTRKGCDAWADAMMDLIEMVDRLTVDNAGLRRQLQQMQDVSTMTVEQLHDLRDAIDKRLVETYRAKPAQQQQEAA